MDSSRCDKVFRSGESCMEPTSRSWAPLGERQGSVSNHSDARSCELSVQFCEHSVWTESFPDFRNRGQIVFTVIHFTQVISTLLCVRDYCAFGTQVLASHDLNLVVLEHLVNSLQDVSAFCAFIGMIVVGMLPTSLITRQARYIGQMRHDLCLHVEQALLNKVSLGMNCVFVRHNSTPCFSQASSSCATSEAHIIAPLL